MSRRIRVALLICTALPLAMNAQARGAEDTQNEAALTRIQTTMARPDAMCGDFEQQKSLVGLQRPVKSFGRFCVLTGRGVLWSTLRPFTSTLMLSRAEIVESQGARVTSRLSAGEEPSVAVISDLLSSVLGGDFRRLRSRFDIAASIESGATATWRAKLTPNDAGMRRLISTIELEGEEFVRQITIAEESGDRTIIAFTAIASGMSALRPDERRAFGAIPK